MQGVQVHQGATPADAYPVACLRDLEPSNRAELPIRLRKTPIREDLRRSTLWLFHSPYRHRSPAPRSSWS
jgi:hypothetical protein